MPKKKAMTPPAKDDLLDLAWRLAPYLDFQSWELRGCPPRKPIVLMMQEAREFVESLVAFQQPNPAPGVGGREIVEEMLKNADLLVAATMTRGNGKVLELLKPEGTAQTKVQRKRPMVVNRYGLFKSDGAAYLRTDLLPHIVVIRMLDLALAADDRKAAKPTPEIRRLLDSARSLDKRVCKGVSCDLKTAPGPNRPKINPFVSAASNDLRDWYALFCEPLLGMMVGGADALDVRGRGNMSPITMLMLAMFWRSPGWVRFLKPKSGEDFDLWRYDQDEAPSHDEQPKVEMPAWANKHRMKDFRGDLRAFIKAAGARISMLLTEELAECVNLPPEAGPWLNDAGTSSVPIKWKDFAAEAEELDNVALAQLSERATDFGYRYLWPLGWERCKELETRLVAKNHGGNAVTNRDAAFVADHRSWVTACARAVVKAAALAGSDVCVASANLSVASAYRADSAALGELALESAKGGLVSSTLNSEEVRTIRVGLDPTTGSKSLFDRAINLLVKPEAAYRRLRLTFELADQVSNCYARYLEGQDRPEEQEKHLAKIRVDLEKVESVASEAGVDLALGKWSKTKNALRGRFSSLRKAIPQYRQDNPIALEDLDLVIAGADARVRVMESLLKLPPKKRKVGDRKASAW